MKGHVRHKPGDLVVVYNNAAGISRWIDGLGIYIGPVYPGDLQQFHYVMVSGRHQVVGFWNIHGLPA